MESSSATRCRRYRRRILEISQQVDAAHVAPAFSCIEIVDALYHEVMRPQDIFIMSKGHGCLAQYVVLEDREWPTRSRESKHERLLDRYCAGGKLGAHPDRNRALGIHASTGSLGHGLGIAAGQALAEKMQNTDARVYVLLSDGECQEGSTWEAAMVAANLGLGNLVALVDYNDFTGMDRMSAKHPALAPLAAKFSAFAWDVPVSIVDGHQSHEIVGSIRMAEWYGARPGAIVFRTIKGKGVSFIENDPIWHYRSPSPEEYQAALEELCDSDSSI